MSNNVGTLFRGRHDSIIESEPEYSLSASASYSMSAFDQTPRRYSSSAATTSHRYPLSPTGELPGVENLSITSDSTSRTSANRHRGFRATRSTPDSAVMSSAAYPRHQAEQSYDNQGTASTVGQNSGADVLQPEISRQSSGWTSVSDDPSLYGIGGHAEQWHVYPIHIDLQTPTVSPSTSYSSDGEIHPLPSPALSTASMYVHHSHSPGRDQHPEGLVLRSEQERIHDGRVERRQNSESRRKTKKFRVQAARQHVVSQRNERCRLQQPTHQDRIDEVIYDNPYSHGLSSPQYQVQPAPAMASWLWAPNPGALTPEAQDFLSRTEPHQGELNRNHQSQRIHSSERRHGGSEYQGGSR